MSLSLPNPQAVADALENLLDRAAVHPFKMLSAYVWHDGPLELYARALDGASALRRYALSLEPGTAYDHTTPCKALVISNITIADAFQHQGFLTRLLELVESMPGLHFIEFESVVSPPLNAWLRTRGYTVRVSDAILVEHLIKQLRPH
ncbi:hypothetical protein [Comamonas thiooxydans]|uniref:hypothetical protein n=1 Tax=Comamonas thiooxydans TaxID=363952 RepID=UPI000B41378A|nr:hypothetical protein [Comamonas thiooxydans]